MKFNALKIENLNQKKYLISMKVKDLKKFDFIQKNNIERTSRACKKKNRFNQIEILKNNEEVMWKRTLELDFNIEENNRNEIGILYLNNLKDIKITIYEDISNLTDDCILSFEVIKEK